MKIFQWYDRCLTASPILTKVATSGCLFGVGDGMAQRLTTSCQHDWPRTGRMMIWGGVFFAPAGHVWFNLLERIVRTTGKRAIASKIALDMFVYSPPATLAFFTSQGVLSGQGLMPSVQDAWAKLPKTLAVNFAVWPGIQVITFGYVPLQYRVLFINVMCLGWSTFLSMMASEETTMISKTTPSLTLTSSPLIVDKEL